LGAGAAVHLRRCPVPVGGGGHADRNTVVLVSYRILHCDLHHRRHAPDLRAGVTRTSDEIVCRYLPWYEGNAYGLSVGFPLMGVAMIAAGYAPGNPAWLRYGGIFLVGVTPLCTFATVSMWRRCFLRISPSALTVRLVAPKDKPTEIRRERVESITPKIVPNGVGGEALQVEIAYHPADLSTDATKTVVLGPQLSVQQINPSPRTRGLERCHPRRPGRAVRSDRGNSSWPFNCWRVTGSRGST
jgi:hypothetical protein